MDFFRGIDRFLSAHLTPAVKKIFLANVLVFIAIQFMFGFLPRTSSREIIDVFLAENPYYDLPAFFLWQFLTYMFVHIEPLHIFFNMFILWFFAPDLEARWGTSRFWRFYLLTGIGAGLFHSLVRLIFQYEAAPVIGASGALMGVLLASAAYYPNRRVYVWGVFPITLKWLIAFTILFEIFALRGATGNVSHITHIGGLITAYIYLTGYHRTADIARWRFMG